MTFSAPLEDIRRCAATALEEDVGRGDLTTAPLDCGQQATATLVFREAGVVCGMPLVVAVYERLDAAISVTALAEEGAWVEERTAVARIVGHAAPILTGERVALNFVGRLSGTATLTRRVVETIGGTHAQLLDTRKTTPGLRALEKYAVRVGGARNHRFGLDSGVLLKDNHLRLAGSISVAIARVRSVAPPGLRIEVEVEDIAGLEEALRAGADMILLDNMSPALLRRAVELVAGRVPLEASGGITFENAREIAETGVDFLSSGALTHSARSLDVALDLAL